MPRLLILCEYPTLLGGERSMLATLPTSAAAEFNIVVASPAGGPLAATLQDRGVAHIPWQTHDESGERFPLDRLRSELEDVLQRARPDLLHANSLSAARIAGPVAVERSVRSLGHLRDIIKVSGKVIDDLNQHTRLVAVSHATRDFHVSQGLDAANCVVLHNGVDLAEFRPRPSSGYLHRDLKLPPAARLIAVIGQLGLRKGTEIALTAAARVARSVPDVHWLLVGERTSNKPESLNFEDKLNASAAEPPLAGRVHFLGSRRDVSQLLPECMLLVHTARQEPLGRVLLEAAACGLAVIATDVGGTREIFPPESNAALLIPPDNPDELTDAALSLLNDEDYRRALSAAARRRAEQAFDIRVAAARLADLYRSLLKIG